MSGTDQGATPGVYQILDGSEVSNKLTAEQKFRLNKATDSATESLMTDTERQFGVVMVEAQEDDTPLDTSQTGATINLTTGIAYFVSVPSGGTTFVLPSISSANPNREDKLHTILIQFETHNSASVAFNFPSGTVVVASGAGIALNKHYTASCMYRKYWTGSVLDWKWVVTITEDTV